MINFLKETALAIVTAGKTTDDIIQIGGGEYRCTWEEFVKLADFDYHEGHKAVVRIAVDLTIVFNDGSWLERTNYDGWEKWRHQRTPASIFLRRKPITRLCADEGQYLHEESGCKVFMNEFTLGDLNG